MRRSVVAARGESIIPDFSLTFCRITRYRPARVAAGARHRPPTAGLHLHYPFMAKERILVVEDDEGVACIVQRHLECCGYLVAGRVASGEEALAQARQ